MKAARPRYVEVVVYAPRVEGAFHYHLPPELAQAVQVGQLVEVPFGRQQVHGVVVAEVTTPEVPVTKPVTAIVDPEAVLTPAQIALARHLARTTLAPLSACVALMLPPGVAQRAEREYALAPEAPAEPPADLGPVARRLWALLRQRGPLRSRQIDRRMPRRMWQPAAERLLRRGWLTARPVLAPPRVRPRRVRTVALAVSPAEAQARRHEVAPARFPQALARRQAVLDALLRAAGPLDAAWLYAETGANLADLQALEKQGLVRLGEAPRWRDPLAEVAAPPPATPPPLTAAQQAAWAPIQAAIRAAVQGHPPAKPFLLHGVTGSGKTEIYLRAVAETLAQGRQAVVLVPEIALTPQTVQRFLARFPGQVGVLHSRLSDGERYDTWRRVRRGEVRVLVGPRSALFAPFPHLGLIVVDECHDDSYYQSETPPHYHARRVAQAYARLTGALCLLGSATPEVTTYHRAQQGELTLLRLPDRILAHREQVKAWLGEEGDSLTPKEGPQPQGADQAPKSRPTGTQGRSAQPQGPVPSPQVFRPGEGEALFAPLPPVQVVDMRAELRQGHTGIFSRPLLAALDDTLRRGEQAILFLNRRGAATYVFCRDCGHVLKCPRCEIPLTYHRSNGRLVCHHCGYTRQMPKTCPACGGRRIRAYGAGTERVEAEVQRHFPQARTLRWDAESVRGKAGHEIILSHFAHRRADVLIGTQMLAKGLDLPFVTLVGVVLADVGLNLPDYRAAERAFQVLTQVAGRAGRSPLGGRVILQTYLPEHYVIQAAARHDVAGFYATELALRQRLGYPPFVRLVRLVLRHREAQTAQRQAEALAQQLRQRMRRQGYRATQMIGPAPCFFAREAGLYRWQIILRGPDPTGLVRGLRLPDGWDVEVDPPSLL